MGIDIYIHIEIDTGGDEPYVAELYSCGITHNLSPMWQEAGIKDTLYGSHGMLAGDIIEELDKGLVTMKENPKKFNKLNPANGWGNYSGAVSFLENLIAACRSHPKGELYVWR